MIHVQLKATDVRAVIAHHVPLYKERTSARGVASHPTSSGLMQSHCRRRQLSPTCSCKQPSRLFRPLRHLVSAGPRITPCPKDNKRASSCRVATGKLGWERACELLHADRKSARFRTHALVVCRVHLPPRIAGVLRQHPGLLRLPNGVGSSIFGAVGRQEDVGGFANRPISSPRRKAEWLEDPARQRRLYLQLAYAGTASGEPIFLRSKRTLTPMTSVAVAFRAAASAWAGVMCAQEEGGYWVHRTVLAFSRLHQASTHSLWRPL